MHLCIHEFMHTYIQAKLNIFILAYICILAYFLARPGESSEPFWESKFRVKIPLRVFNSKIYRSTLLYKYFIIQLTVIWVLINSIPDTHKYLQNCTLGSLHDIILTLVYLYACTQAYLLNRIIA